MLGSKMLDSLPSDCLQIVKIMMEEMSSTANPPEQSCEEETQSYWYDGWHDDGDEWDWSYYAEDGNDCEWYYEPEEIYYGDSGE